MVVGEVATETEVLVIGGGPGGYVAAIRAAQLGKDVTLVEKDRLGGVCLNVGCIPSKALIDAAKAYHRLSREAERGIVVEGARLDFSRLQGWKQSVVQRLTGGVEQLLKGNGVTVVKGRATFTGPNQVLVENPGGGNEVYRFKHCILATGSRPVELPGFAFDGVRILDSTDALALDHLPLRLVVIGGGYIGLELGTAFAKLGSEVTVLELADQLLPGTDPELVQVVARRLRQLGVKVHTGVRVLGWEQEPGGEGVRVVFRPEPRGEGAGSSGAGGAGGPGGGAAGARAGAARAGAGAPAADEQAVVADAVLVSVGRRPNTDGLGLELAGVQLDERGRVKVDAQLRTTQPHIFAIGDIAPGPMLAHKASREGIVAAEVLAGLPSAADYVAVPAPVFTDPEIATVGLTEAQARQQGYEPVVGRFPYAANGRALTLGERDGFVKLVADRETKVLLGAGIVGPEASDLVAELALAIEMGATLEDVALTIHAHPTLSEAVMEAAEAGLGHAIHVLGKR
ncbi:dihydrolipoamide dehydrogenase [Thermaerobacter marianensis DSM 12885]|uniref:Dihydrolipoyl dehydrogenase n=1 Tax=Thermaerobacter marianensis (strain ATCC 700841 / DSM 12885 / JCM 10246 / 7p75a) TaxID=644966 RepID=E6SHI4_THEM7|nr:dihydrolipoyl dehydrogenase [Thermaerobacter marianensis]ADU51779.1 dihydrolipoamide dehydrogenase [Thermaerobacter marianensis DSM 12885]